MIKKKLLGIAGAITICAVLLFLAVNGKQVQADPREKMIERLENALGDEYKKQSMTELAATLQYGDDEGNTVNYYILKTTYYEADPTNVTGLNTGAISLIVDTQTAERQLEMKIQDWDAALYRTDTLSYLCWTYSPEVSYILEYNADAIPDEEIIKMAESAKLVHEE